MLLTQQKAFHTLADTQVLPIYGNMLTEVQCEWIQHSLVSHQGHKHKRMEIKRLITSRVDS